MCKCVCYGDAGRSHSPMSSAIRRTKPTNKQTTENSSHTHFKKIKQTLQWQCFSAFTVNCWNLCLNMQTLNCVFFRLAVRIFFLFDTCMCLCVYLCKSLFNFDVAPIWCHRCFLSFYHRLSHHYCSHFGIFWYRLVCLFASPFFRNKISRFFIVK